jgi:cell division protein FtsL
MLDYAISIKYMLAGYAVILLVLAIYVVSLYARWQRLKHDLHTLKNLEEQQ